MDSCSQSRPTLYILRVAVVRLYLRKEPVAVADGCHHSDAWDAHFLPFCLTGGVEAAPMQVYHTLSRVALQAPGSL